MPTYRYSAINRQGEQVQGVLEVHGPDLLRKQLEEQGLMLLSSDLVLPAADAVVPPASFASALESPKPFGWVARYSFGAVQSRTQAFIVITALVIAGGVTALNLWTCLNPSAFHTPETFIKVDTTDPHFPGNQPRTTAAPPAAPAIDNLNEPDAEPDPSVPDHG